MAVDAVSSFIAARQHLVSAEIDDRQAHLVAECCAGYEIADLRAELGTAVCGRRARELREARARPRREPCAQAAKHDERFGLG
jgi:hypothetical protein